MVDTALSAPTCFILLVFTGGHLHCLYSFVYTQSETEILIERACATRDRSER